MNDGTIHAHINELVEKEHSLRERFGRGEITSAEEQRELRAAEVELDRLWDLLRQRQARREFGENPDEATERPASVVEDYRS